MSEADYDQLSDLLDQFHHEQAMGADISTQQVKVRIRDMVFGSQPGSQYVQKVLGHYLSS